MGFVSSVITLGISVGILAALGGIRVRVEQIMTHCFSDDNEMFGLRFVNLLMGVWWFIFSLWTFRYLKVRPGPPLVTGTNYLVFSWRRSMYITYSKVRAIQ